MPLLLRTLGHFAAPVALLGLAFVLVLYSAALPASLSGLKTYGPYFVFLLGAAHASARTNFCTFRIIVKSDS